MLERKFDITILVEGTLNMETYRIHMLSDDFGEAFKMATAFGLFFADGLGQLSSVTYVGIEV